MNAPLVTVQRFLTEHKTQLAAALPKHLNADRMARLALTALSQNRALAECDAKSIFGAVVVASQLGLEIGVLGQGFLVPYKGRATFIPGWQGLVDLVGRAGRSACWTGAVFRGDEFDWALGDAPYVKHRPAGDSDPRNLTHVYAIGRVNGSNWPIIEVWPIGRIWAHRDRYNKVGQKHYSYEHQEMYARKVVLLQVLKYLPKSPEITAAIELSNRTDAGEHASINADFEIIDEGAEGGSENAASISASLKPQQRLQEAPRPQAAPAAPIDSQWPEVGESAPSGPNNAYLDRLAMIKDAESIEQLDYIAGLADDDLSENEATQVHRAIVNKRAKLDGKK